MKSSSPFSTIKIWRLYLVLNICIILTACATFNSPNHPTPKLDWTKDELALINTFWIENLNSNPAEQNPLYNNPHAVKLGHQLFFDARFSANNQISCASCHQPEKYFTDGLNTARGIDKTRRNTPTIVGTTHNIWYFWDGRADSAWAQSLGPLENPLEHGGNRIQFIQLIYKDSSLKSLYQNAFGKLPVINQINFLTQKTTGISPEEYLHLWQTYTQKDQKTITSIFVNLGKAIAAYENQIQLSPSRFDRYVESLQNNIGVQNNLLNSTEISGLKLFISKARCFICHTGPLFTDNSFHNIGIPPLNNGKLDWGRYKGIRALKKSSTNCLSEYNNQPNKNCDELRYAIMEKNETLGSMKTPGLRNVTKTAPYMHAGQLNTLEQVLKNYNNPPAIKFRQSDLFAIDLNKNEIANLLAFLKTLDSPIAAKPELLQAPLVIQ